MTTKKQEKFTNVNVLVSESGNALLTNAADRNHRSKRKEAKARLEHHLQTYGSDWTEKVLLKR
ncbi:TraY domain-containing protein [Photobacterium damselae]|uniref:TraY domain-containing protein n=1 Tax=Photobacterium damselae TaxID=38293 RepID=UPI0010FE9C1C|nr:TraY domain-containing protein [Photobacterium damselae]TLS79813.1 TraY domain-containing protein [Photobacterium damselae subsp. damselae]TLS89937.1 TraY domain-containing protein [Photobacterium damselae subsp. damselae]